MKYGIDISEFQDSAIIAEIKPDFVILRAGYSYSEDANYKSHVAMCHKMDIPFGAYWYSYAQYMTSASKEALTMINVIESCAYRPQLGLWYDIEDPSIDTGIYGSLASTFCTIIENHGYYSGIYTSESKLGYLTGCDAFDKWVANWGDNNGEPDFPAPSSGTMWQFTSKYKGRNLDGDICKYDDMSFYDLKGYGSDAGLTRFERYDKYLEELEDLTLSASNKLNEARMKLNEAREALNETR